MMSRPAKLVCALASWAVLASGCLLAVDFDEYGAGGGSSTSATTGASSSGEGGGGDAGLLAVCEAESARYIVLPEGWRNVHIAPSGSGFVTAPDGELDYVSLPEGGNLDVRERAEVARDVAGVFTLLGSNGSARPYAVLGDGEVKVVPFFDGSSSTLGNVFVDVHQNLPAFGSLLSELTDNDGHSFGAFGFVRGESNELSTFPFGPTKLVTVDADVDFAAHVMIFSAEPDPVGFLAVVGTAPSPTTIGVTEVSPGAFFVGVKAFTDGTIVVEVFSLGSLLVEAHDVEFPTDREDLWVAGVSPSGENALVVTGESGSGTSDGPALAPWPSLLASDRWLVNTGTLDSPILRLHATGKSSDVLLEVEGIFGSEIASVKRDEGNARIGTLISAVVGDTDVTVDGCLLPAGRRVLIEHDLDSPN